MLQENAAQAGNAMMHIGAVDAGKLDYNPDQLLDVLMENMRLKNDAALCRALSIAPPMLSKIRHRRLPIGASLLIAMHDVSGVSIRDLRYLMGDQRDKFSPIVLG